jgi:hypothetical protein
VIKRLNLDVAHREYSEPDDLVTNLIKLSDVINLYELKPEAQELTDISSYAI